MEISDENRKSSKEVCLICYDASDGIHFGAFTCRACAAFFRRTVSMRLEYCCRSKQQCIIDKAQRNMCRSCRFKKCLSQGMQITAVQNSRDGIGKRKRSETSPSTSTIAYATSSSDVVKPAIQPSQNIPSNVPESNESLKVLGKMHEGYMHFLTIRKATNSMLTNNMNGEIFTNQQDIKASNFDSCKKVCQWEAHLITDVINTYFHPFSTLPFPEKIRLFQSFFCYLSHTDPAYQSYKRFGHLEENDRLVMPDGGYIEFNQLEKFYVNCQGVHSAPEEAANLFRPAMDYIVNVIIAHMKRIQISEIEYVAILGFFLWNDAVLSLLPDTVNMIHNTQAIILDDLHVYYRLQNLPENEITRKIGELMLLLPKLTRSVFILRENSHLAELFDLFDADICCKNNFNEYGP